jgi:hypothetical protein
MILKTDRYKEIGRRLSVGGLIPHVDEVLSCFISWPEIRHSPFVYDANLVEQLVKCLSGLVNGNNGSHTIHICSDPEGTDKSSDVGISSTLKSLTEADHVLKGGGCI